MADTKKDKISSSLLERLELFDEKMEGVEILKTTKAYGYYYADLSNIISIIKPVLKECGIGYYHSTGFDDVTKNNYLKTSLYNKDKEQQTLTSTTLIDGEAILAKMNRFMVEGSAITYFRRYHLTTMLKLITDEDTDAGGKQPTKQSPGRSVEATSQHNQEVDFISIFDNMVKNKPQEQVEKNLETYKTQISSEDYKTISDNINKHYDNK